MKIQRETVEQASKDIGPLLDLHWREVALYQDEIALAPDFERYRQMEARGALVVITARREDELIGYSVFIVTEHLHYKACRAAVNDVIFMRSESRGVAGMRLIRESERILGEAGAHRITWHIKPEHDWSRILSKLGYQQEEIIMGKLIGSSHGL